MEELQARHRKEQQELQSRITQKKKNATKRTRKGINDDCDVLQADLLERQQAELAAVSQDSIADQVDKLKIDSDVEIPGDPALPSSGGSKREGTNSSIVDITSTHKPAASLAQSAPAQVKKPNRRKVRLNRRAAEQEALAEQAAKEAANLPDRREQELEAMQKLFEKHGLTEISVRPDGHCLYSAVAVQLQDKQLLTNEKTPSSQPYQVVRNTAGNFISNHPADFGAFLEEPLHTYVSKIKQTAEWGGQLELQALSRAYNVGINILQADGRIEKIEPETASFDKVLWLAYYRHSFGLGEHYNALKGAA